MDKQDDAWQLLIERNIPSDPAGVATDEDDILAAVLGIGCPSTCVDQVRVAIKETISVSFYKGSGFTHEFRSYIRIYIHGMNPQPASADESASWGIFIVQMTSDALTLITELFLYREGAV